MKIGARSRLTATSVLLGLGLAVCGPALGSEPAPAPADRVSVVFGKVDTDKDNVITRAEWQAAGRKQRGFDMLDENGDGKVTPDEMRTVLAKFGR